MPKSKDNPIEQAMQDALASVERIEREGRGDAPAPEEVTVEVEAGQSPPDESPSSKEAASEKTPDEQREGAPEAEQAQAQEAEPAAEERVAELKDQLLRLAADFENFRKRARREQEELRKYGIDTTVRELLPVLDNLERALKHAADDDPMAQGVNMVAKQFRDVLERFGVVGFQSVGQPFDPERHEAMGQAPGGDVEPGTVLEEMEKGYTLHDRLLRPAKVIVAAAPAE